MKPASSIGTRSAARAKSTRARPAAASSAPAWSALEAMTQALHGRRGANFTMRLTSEQRIALEALQRQGGAPRALGPWLVWRAPSGGGTAPAPRLGNTAPARHCPSSGTAPPGAAAVPHRARLVLDLCAGSGSWSQPYVDAGYRV